MQTSNCMKRNKRYYKCSRKLHFVNSPCSFLLCIQACLFVIHVIKINKWCTFWSTTYTKVWTFYFAWLTWRSSMGMSVDEWLTSKSINFFETSAKRLFNTGAGTLNQQNKSITPSQSLAQWPLWTDIAVLSHLVIERYRKNIMTTTTFNTFW